MAKVDEPPQIYPILLQEDYRLREISRIQSELKKEVERRSALHKKYKRAVNILDGVDTGASTLGIILGGVGTGCLLTLVGSPIVPIMMGISAGCGLLIGGLKVSTRRLQRKARKHDQIKVLAQAKLDSVAELVSKALNDGKISHEEFQLIVREAERYYEMKKELQTPKKIDSVAEKELIERGRKEACYSFIKKIEAGN
jgi:hypothetical protein